MKAHVLEGTVREVREQLDRLSLPPDTRVRLIVEGTVEERDETQPTATRNGIRLIPTRAGGSKVTTEQVLDLLDSD